MKLLRLERYLALFLIFLFSFLTGFTTMGTQSAKAGELIPVGFSESIDGEALKEEPEEIEDETEESPEETENDENPRDEDEPEKDPRVSAFVTRFYRLCLGRQPDADGLEYWIEQLSSGKITGADAARYFIFSPEFTNKKVSDLKFVAVMYSTFFDRDPDDQGQEFWLDLLDSGYNRLYVLAGFVNSEEYSELCDSYGLIPGTIDIEPTDLHPRVSDFVTRFYRLCLGREPDTNGLNTWVDNLTSGKITGADAARGFIFSSEFTGRNVSDQEYLNVMYRAFFDREPDDEGNAHWLKDLSSGKNRLYVLAGFVNSSEYQKLCRSYGITPGTIVIPVRGLITFVLDDGTLNQYQRIFPIFQSRGIPAVWSIPTALINIGSFQGYPLANWSQIDYVAQNSSPRWEINSHSHTHSTEMIRLNDAQVIYQMVESKNRLAKYGVHSFTYPYYSVDNRVAQRTSQYYEAAYAGGVSSNNLVNEMHGAGNLNNINYSSYVKANRYKLKRVTLTNMRGELLYDVNQKNWRALIDTAYKNDGWLIFCLHNVNDNSEAELRRIIDYSFQVGIPIGVTRDGLGRYGG